METVSKRVLAAMLLLCASWVYVRERPIKDPQVIIGGGPASSGGGSVDSAGVGSPFTFVSLTGTSPITLTNGSPCVLGTLDVLDCLFTNVSGFNWNTLSISVSPSGQTPPFSCSALAYFTSCVFNRSGTEVTFTGGTGIQAGVTFLIEGVLWAPESSFQVTGSTKASGVVGALYGASDSGPEPQSGELAKEGNVTVLGWRRSSTSRP